MNLEFILEIMLKSIVLSFCEATGYYLDIYCPFTSLLARVGTIVYLFRFRALMQLQNNSNIWPIEPIRQDLLHKLTLKLQKSDWVNKILKVFGLRAGRPFGITSYDFNYGLLCFTFALILRLFIDTVKFLLNKTEVKQSWDPSDPEPAVSELSIALCYIMQVLVLLGLIYYNVPSSYKVRPSKSRRSKKNLFEQLPEYLGFNIIRYFMVYEQALLILGLISIYLMALIISRFKFKSKSITFTNFWILIHKTSYMWVDTLTRIACLNSLGLLFYLNIAEQVSEIFIISFSALKSNSQYYSSISKTKTTFLDKVMYYMPYFFIFLLGMVLELNVMWLDLELCLDIRILYITIICDCIVYYSIYFFKAQGKANRNKLLAKKKLLKN